MTTHHFRGGGPLDGRLDYIPAGQCAHAGWDDCRRCLLDMLSTVSDEHLAAVIEQMRREGHTPTPDA